MSADAAMVSVVIPAYNAARWVGETLESVLAQTVRAAQVIVVDDGSTDGTREVVGRYVGRGGIEYVYQANAGVAAARNNGVGRARQEFVAFLDSDDVWHRRKLEVQMGVMRERPELVMLGAGTFCWPGEAPEVGDEAAGRAEVGEVAWGALAVKNRFTTSAVVVRREALGRVGAGPFDTGLHGPEDYDLWLRLAEVGRVGNVRLQLTGYRQVEGSLSKQARTMEAGMRRILEKMDQRGAWARSGGPGGRRLRAKARAYVNYSCAQMYAAAGEEGTALRLLGRSVCAYPSVFDRSEMAARWGRLRMAGVMSLRLARRACGWTAAPEIDRRAARGRAGDEATAS